MTPKEYKQMMDYLTRSGIRDQVKFLSEVARPQQALDREMFEDANKRLNKAGGGMLVQPGFGGTRQGYAKEKKLRKNSPITEKERAKNIKAWE